MYINFNLAFIYQFSKYILNIYYCVTVTADKAIVSEICPLASTASLRKARDLNPARIARILSFFCCYGAQMTVLTVVPRLSVGRAESKNYAFRFQTSRVLEFISCFLLVILCHRSQDDANLNVDCIARP